MEPSQRRTIKTPGDAVYGPREPEHVREASENGGVSNLKNVSERAGSDERLRFQAQLLDAVGQAIIATDLQGTVLYWNRCAEGQYGWSAQEVMGRALHEFLISEDFWKSAEEIMSQLRAGRSWSGEFAVRRKDGTPLWVEVTDTPVRDDGGNVVGIIGVSTDITERKRSEERLEETERRLSTVLSSTPAMVYRCLNEPDWPKEYVSDYSLELTGYPPSAFMDEPKLFGSLISENDRQRISNEVREAVGKGVRFRLHYAIHHKDGSLRFVEELGQGVYDESGAVVAVEGLIYDGTERKRAEERLRDAESRYRTLVERIPAIVYMQEPHEPSRTTYVSPQNEDILGYPPEACLADPEHWIKIMHPDDRARVLAEDGRTNHSGEAFLMEYRLFAKGGRTVWIRDEATLVGDEEGRPLYWLGVQTDVTERKEAERALARSEASLSESQRIAHLGTWEWDVVTDEVWWSPETYRIFGLNPEEGIPSREKFEAAFSPEDLSAYRRKIGEALSGATGGYDHEHRIRRPDGEVRWVHGQAEVVRDDEGRPSRVVGTIHDVTERGLAETRLRETEARYRSLVEQVPVAIYRQEIEHNGAVSYISPQIESLTGYAPEEYADPTFWVRTMHPEDRQRVLAEDERTDRTGEPFRVEFRKITRDGRIVWLRDEAVLVRDAGGEPLYWQGVVHDITERKALEGRLEHQALHDSLTDLPNRSLFVDRLGQALRRTKRRKDRKVAVLFLDLDNFKNVNDSLGHKAGDLLLMVVAERLRRCLRPEDTLSRFGGDEFVVLIEDAEGPAGAIRVAERIVDELRRPFTIEGKELFVAASIGIAVGEDWKKSPEDLLRDADTAMYRAKAEASDYRVFDPGMYLMAVGRLELENDLRRAVERNEFVLHYQPIVRLGDGRVRGVEALVRWDHPERGFLNPDEFVPAAEESGLVVPMGERVLEEACRQAREWQGERPRTRQPVVAVNLSARQLMRPDLTEMVEEALSKTGFDGSCLTLDVTETAYVEVLEGNTAALDRLKAMGVRISIDDFGTGYSSLSYLKRLPADALKIDRSFVRGLGWDTEDTAVVRMTVELAHTFGMDVIAEGVETEEQAALLEEMGCDLAQGYLFSEPLAAQEAANLLDAVYNRDSVGGR